MTLEEFQKSIGGKHATLMVCQVDGSQFNGFTYKSGDRVNVELRTAYALVRQKANTPDGEVNRWEAEDANMTAGEMANLNQHFEKEHNQEMGDKPVQIKKHKK